jgi:hypothetical protein
VLPSLTLAQLNRALLARQMLVARENVTPVRAIERLAGLQAQLARPPYIGLWSRLESFERADLNTLLTQREVVRATAMRATIHLMSARDYVRFRPALQPMLTQAVKSIFAEADGFDLTAIVAAARACFAREPCTFDALRAKVGRQFPQVNDRLLGYAVRMHLPLVQVPTDAPWGYPAAADFAVAEDWLGAPIARETDGAGPLMLCYLAAFGPASVADAQSWSGLRGLRETFEQLRPKLVVFKGDRRTELFDLPDAPRPSGAEAPDLPVRFLPDYDNILLAYADRSRIVDPRHRPRLTTRNLQVPATFLVAGRVAGIWKIVRKRSTATLTLDAFDPQPKKVRKALEIEGTALAKFVEPDAGAVEIVWSGG